MKNVLILLSLTILAACSAPLKTSNSNQAAQAKSKLASNNTDKSYGYSMRNPIKVGDGNLSNGPANERKYLNVLLGPNGEQVNYRRLGSCCPIKTPNGYNGGGLLDMYEVTYKGLKKSKILFFNMYDSSKTKIPHGFKAIN